MFKLPILAKEINFETIQAQYHKNTTAETETNTTNHQKISEHKILKVQKKEGKITNIQTLKMGID